MAPLSPASTQALARLRSYVSPPTAYSSLPLSRRAAVLVLLFADRRGDLRVLLTMRSKTLRTFAGEVALPGGKADSPTETPAQTARREAYEEIGLPQDAATFPPPFTVEHLCELPCSLSRTHVAMRPVIAFLHDTTDDFSADVEDLLEVKLDPNEVSSVFTVPLKKFLNAHYDENGSAERADGVSWYKGQWLSWGDSDWRAHEFLAPVWERSILTRYRVWGTTARIVLDSARVAYGVDPEFEHNQHIGDEGIIEGLLKSGKLKENSKIDDFVKKMKPVKGNL